MAAILFVATGAALWHQDAPGATFCPMCHAAHLPALRSVPARTPVISFAVTWAILPELRLNHATPETLNTSPRAPPA
jgi:hypothetical protein